MSTSLTTSHQNERWELGDQVWSRNPTTGAFDLADYRGLGAAPATFNPLDLATLVGARVSFDEADRGASRSHSTPGRSSFLPSPVERCLNRLSPIWIRGCRLSAAMVPLPTSRKGWDGQPFAWRCGHR